MRRLTPLATVAALLLLAMGGTAHANVTVENYAFTGSPTTVAMGGSVQWDWGTGSHSVTSSSAEVFDSGVHIAAHSFAHQFNTPGTYSYYCVVHGAALMSGTVNVAGITGRVLADSDNSNTASGSDTGLDGVAVTLYDAVAYQNDPQGAAPLTSTLTDATGRYRFQNPNAPSGGVTVTVAHQPGFGASQPVMFQVGDQLTAVNDNKDILIPGAGTVSGTVWNDVNGNGVHDAPEAGKPGVQVSVSGGRPATTTAPDGTYAFANVPPGASTVSVTAPAAFAVIGSASRPVNLQNPDYAASGQDFFVREAPGSISGVVHDDPNGNHAVDAGEGGLGGVTIGLDNNGDGAADTTVNTAADGIYSFGNLAARTYRVVLNVPDGFENTGFTAIDVNLAAGSNTTGADFFARKIPAALTPPAAEPPPSNSPEETIELLGSGQGTPGDDLFNGTGGPDRMFGLGGNDVLLGLGGNDLLDGGDGNDNLDGGSGKDTLKGGNGNDSLTGGPGDDKLSGGPGKDKLSGGPGNDTLDGGPAKDALNGGSGNDTINSKDGVAELVNCGPGKDKVKADKQDRLKACEKKSVS